MVLPDCLNNRPSNSHKGNYGHALLVAGSYGKMGCAILAAKSCLRSGVGLLTVHLPERGLLPVQCAVPEAMTSIDCDGLLFANLPPNLTKYNALAIGPGIGTADRTYSALKLLLSSWGNRPLVLDADALNIIALHKDELLPILPHNAILTPHAAEYERLFHNESPACISQRHNIIIVQKGFHTKVYSPTDPVFENPTGNPGMATAGSGDVLTGIILALLAQGVPPFAAATLGVCLHGKAGDFAVKSMSQASLIASDLIENLKYVTM